MVALGKPLSSKPLHLFLHETINAAKSAVSLYFRPLHWAANPIPNTSRSLVRHSRSELDRKELDLVTLIKSAVCYNQGALIEYSFLIAEKHKAMKSAFVSKESLDKLRELTNDLMNFLNRDFFEITFKNFDFIHSYFSLRKRNIPRICIKGNFNADSSETIISIFRDSAVLYNSDTAIKNNSGFFSIKQNGRFFLENNIPEAVLQRDYLNPRLDTSRIKRDAASGKTLTQITDDWDSYWHDYKPWKKGDTSFYKSTLIVPLTLWNNDLSSEFKRRISIENIDRVIFGFLCFDHRNTNFFDETDVNVAYIFADLLCVYVFDRIAYTDASKTFEKVKRHLGDENASLDIDKFDPMQIRKLADKILQANAVIPTAKETTKNQLVSVDEVLLNSVRPDIERVVRDLAE